jgi:AcrR family transcriptional regulator
MERPRVRKPAVERRREIAEAALSIIGRQGAAALTTATLSAEVRLTTGALFRHFATLDDVLREAVRRAFEKMEPTFPDPALPPLERIFGLARNRVRILSTDPGLAWLLRSEEALLALPEDAVASLRSLVSRSQRYLLEAIQEGAREGSIRSDVEPEALLVPVTGTIQALAGMSGLHRVAGGGRKHQTETVLEALRRMLAPSGKSEGKRRGPRVEKEKNR